MRKLIRFLFPDEPGSASRRFFLTSAAWMVVGILFGFADAIEMTAPDLYPVVRQLSFGRLRPSHVNMVIFGFLLPSYFGAFMYIVPTVCRAPLYGQRLANLTVWLWNLVAAGIVVSLPNGFTQGREYAELPWILDVAILFVYLLFAIIVFGTMARRQERLLYVSAWYVGGGVLWTFFVYATGNVVWHPPTGSWTGLSDQILMWFYGHNVVGLVITPMALASAYYCIPRITRTPLWSHTLSLIGFYGLLVTYTHTGSHHLLQAPIPQWLKVIAVVNSVALLLPVFAFLTNVWLPMKNRFDRLFNNPGGKFILAGTVFYFITCVQGPFQSLPSVQKITHFTQWVIAHAHLALLGFAGFIAVGSAYFLLPLVMNRRLYSVRLADIHYWLMFFGLMAIFLPLTAAGLIQGNSWFNGEMVYRVLPELKVYFLIRAMAGIFMLSSAVIYVVQVAGTILGRGEAAQELREPSGEEAAA